MEKRRVWRGASRVLTWVLIAISVVLLAFTMLTFITGKESASLFGFRAYTVLTDSMAENNEVTFRAGDMIVCREVNPSTLQEGDIITFQCMDEESDAYQKIITHKIKEKRVIDDTPCFITYGTTTGVADKEPVAYNYVQGKYQFKIPRAGNFLEWIRTPVGYTLVIGIPFLLLISVQLIACIRAWRTYGKVKKEEREEEREKLKAEERAETLLLMEELKRLREELAAVKQVQQSFVASISGEKSDVAQEPSAQTDGSRTEAEDAPSAEAQDLGQSDGK